MVIGYHFYYLKHLIWIKRNNYQIKNKYGSTYSQILILLS